MLSMNPTRLDPCCPPSPFPLPPPLQPPPPPSPPPSLLSRSPHRFVFLLPRSYRSLEATSTKIETHRFLRSSFCSFVFLCLFVYLFYFCFFFLFLLCFLSVFLFFLPFFLIETNRNLPVRLPVSPFLYLLLFSFTE